jgi:hypothetical protein
MPLSITDAGSLDVLLGKHGLAAGGAPWSWQLFLWDLLDEVEILPQAAFAHLLEVGFSLWTPLAVLQFSFDSKHSHVISVDRAKNSRKQPLFGIAQGLVEALLNHVPGCGVSDAYERLCADVSAKVPVAQYWAAPQGHISRQEISRFDGSQVSNELNG